jgi:hypothetical protein
MAKKATITPVTDTVNNASAINTQLNAINNQLDNTLSLDGSTPNAMNADLDLNSNDILNVGSIQAADIIVAGGTINGVLAAAAASAVDSANSATDSLNSATASATSATEASLSAAQAALFDGPWLDDVTTLLADTALTYTAGQPSTVAAGGYVRTRSEGFSYEVAASGAVDQHVTTAGGIKLYVLPGDSGVNITAFNPPNDGASDDTPFFLAASLVSNSVYVPDTGTPFKLNGLNVGFDIRIWGAGSIETSSGEVIELSTVDLAPDEGPMRIMFIEGTNQSWEELLDIKNSGYNTLMPYLWSTPLATIIKNAEAVGLKLLVHSKLVAPATGPHTPDTSFDDRRSVVGYYIFDEPVLNSITVAAQDAMIAVYRAVTDKPIYCAEGAVVYQSTGAMSDNYDGIFLDVYYADSYTTANDSIAQYIRASVAFGAASTNAKLIPLVGLFNSAGFNKSEALTTQLAEYLLNFSVDGGFGVFVWEGTGITKDVRSTATYRTSARLLGSLVVARKPYKIETVAIGKTFTSPSNLKSIIVNTVDGGAPNVAGASKLVPWTTVNVGANLDFRRRTYEDSGLTLDTVTGRVGFSGMPAGICSVFFQWINRTNGGAVTVSLGATNNDGYTTTAAITQVIASGGSAAFYKQLNADIQQMPTLQLDVAVASSFPNDFLRGYLAFTDAQEVTF